MHTDPTSRPLVLTDSDSLDLLDTFEAVEVLALNLRAGMVLVDSDGFSVAVIDHKVRSARNSGEVSYLVENLDRGSKYETARFARNRLVSVAAR